MNHVGRTAAIVLVLAVVAAASATAFVVLGVFDVAATSPHNPLVAWLIHQTALRSIARRAEAIEVPDLARPATAARGFRLFRDNCVQCHGAPGVAPAAFAEGLEPTPPRLMQAGREWAPADLYWTIAHGIKMTAMPAWEFRLGEADMWALVAFIRKLPAIAPADYAAMAAMAAGKGKAADAAREGQPELLRPGDAARGALALRQYACISCHEIPGLAGPGGRVGPPLAGLAERRYIAGVLANTPHNLALWLRHPQQVKASDAMPDMGVSDQSARDIVAYLKTLR